MKKIQQILFTGVIGIISIVFIEGCKSGDGNKVKIAIIAENSSTLDAMMSLKKDYENKHQNVELDFKPSSFDDAFTKSNQDFVNKTGLYDIVLQYNFTLSPSVQNDYVYTITDLTKNISKDKLLFEADIFPSLWKEVGYYYNNVNDPSKGSKMVSYPYLGISMVLMYNDKMFKDPQNISAFIKKYGRPLTVPTTWEDIYTDAEFFTSSERKTYGICMEGAAGPILTAEWTNFLYGMGGKYLDQETGWSGDENTKFLINSPEAIKALTYYKSLKPFNAGTYSDVDQAKQMQIMKEGSVALAIVWTDMLFQTLKTSNGFDTTFKFTTIPGNKSIVCGGAYFINKKTKHPQEAVDYVVSQLQVDNQIQMARMGLCSPLKSTYLDSTVMKIPYSNALQKSLERGGIGLEAGPDADKISNVISAYIQKVWNDELNPEDALNKAQSEMQINRKQTYQDLKIGNK